MNTDRFLYSAFGVKIPRIIYGTDWKKDRKASLVEKAKSTGFGGWSFEGLAENPKLPFVFFPIYKDDLDNHNCGNNMNNRLKKHLLIGFLVLFFGAANPVAAVTETQIALTTEATNEAIVNLEAALKAVTENKQDEAQNYIDATRGSASDILGRCSVEAKKERGANALKNARRQIKSGDSEAAEDSLKEAIKIFKSLLMSVNNSEQPRLFR